MILYLRDTQINCSTFSSRSLPFFCLCCQRVSQKIRGTENAASTLRLLLIFLNNQTVPILKGQVETIMELLFHYQISVTNFYFIITNEDSVSAFRIKNRCKYKSSKVFYLRTLKIREEMIYMSNAFRDTKIQQFYKKKVSTTVVFSVVTEHNIEKNVNKFI